MKKHLKVVHFVLIFLFVFLVGYSFFYFIQGSKLQPYDVRLTNRTDRSLTVTWMTKESTRGIILYWDGWIRIGYDDRDVSVAQGNCVEKLNSDALELGIDDIDCLTDYSVSSSKHYVHSVTLSDLEPTSSYKFVITNLLIPWFNSLDNSYNYSFDIEDDFTFSTVDSTDIEIKEPDPMYGKIYGMVRDDWGILNEDESNDSVVFASIVDDQGNQISNVLSAPANEDGGWSIDKGSFRDLNGDVFEEIDGLSGKICYQYENFEPKECIDIVFGEDDAPVEGIIANTEEDLGSIEDASELLESLVPYVNAAWDRDRCLSVTGATVGNWAALGCENDSPCYQRCEDSNGNLLFYIKEKVIYNCPKVSNCYHGDTGDNQRVDIDGTTYVIADNQTVDDLGNIVTVEDDEITSVLGSNGDSLEEEDVEISNCSSGDMICEVVRDLVTEDTDPVTVYELLGGGDFSWEDFLPTYSPSEDYVPMIEEPTEELIDEDYEISLTSIVDSTENLKVQDYKDACEENGGVWSYKELKNGELSPVCYANQNSADFSSDCSEIDSKNLCKGASWCYYSESAGKCLPSDSNYNFTAINREISGKNAVIVCCKDGNDYIPQTLKDCSGEVVDFSESLACQEYIDIPDNKLQCVTTDGDLCVCDECSDEIEYSLNYVIKDVDDDIELFSIGRNGDVIWNDEYITYDNEKQCYAYVSIGTETFRNIVVSGKFYVKYTASVVKKTCINEGLIDEEPLTSTELKNNSNICYFSGTEGAFIDYSEGLYLHPSDCPSTDGDLEDLYEDDLEKIVSYSDNGFDIDFNSDYVKEYSGNPSVNKICCKFNNDQTTYIERNVEEGCPSGYSLNQYNSQNQCAPEEESNGGALLYPTNILDNLNLVSPVSAEESDELYLSVTSDGYYEVVTSDNQTTIQYLDPDQKYIYYNDTNEDGEFDISDGDYLISSSVLGLSTDKVSNAYNLELKEGLNIVSFNFYPALEVGTSYTAQELMEEANSHEEIITQITYFSNGSWDGGLLSKSSEPGTIAGDNFPLVPGFGYAIVASEDITIHIPGFDINANIPVRFIPGWNLIGINGFSKVFTARSLIDSINSIDGLTADNVTWWPTSKGMYEGLQVSEDTQYGLDFGISSSNGYFVRISDYSPEDSTCKSLIWHPDGELNGNCGNN